MINTDKIKLFIKNNISLINNRQYKDLIDSIKNSELSTDECREFCNMLRRYGVELLNYASIAENWYFSKNAKAIHLPHNIADLARSCFEGFKDLEIVQLSPDLKYIPTNCFTGCISLSHIDLPDQIKSIDGRAFLSSGLSEIRIPNECLTIRSGAFKYCSKLTDVILGDSVVDIASDVFSGVPNLNCWYSGSTRYLSSATNKYYALYRIQLGQTIKKETKYLMSDCLESYLGTNPDENVFYYEGSRQDWSFIQKNASWRFRNPYASIIFKG